MNSVRLIVAVWGAVALATVSVAVAATDAEIVARGSGVVTVKPDLLRLDITLQARESNASKATAKIAEQFDAVLHNLNSLGVEKSDIWTSRFGVEPNWELDKKDHTRKLNGWVATHVVTVRVRSISTAGQVVDSGIGAGATSVGAMTYYVENPDSVQLLALEGAVRNAQSRAETMAEAAGGELGELVDLSTELLTPRERRIQMQMDGATSQAITGVTDRTSLAPQELTVTATVWGKWKFVTRGR